MFIVIKTFNNKTYTTNFYTKSAAWSYLFKIESILKQNNINNYSVTIDAKN